MELHDNSVFSDQGFLNPLRRFTMLSLEFCLPLPVSHLNNVNIITWLQVKVNKEYYIISAFENDEVY